MDSSSNLLVLGATGQVGKLVAKQLKRRKANFSVGSRRKANLEDLQMSLGRRALSISMIHELSMKR
jgi:NAD(P)H dehydrogenase (quinone)